MIFINTWHNNDFVLGPEGGGYDPRNPPPPPVSATGKGQRVRKGGGCGRGRSPIPLHLGGMGERYKLPSGAKPPKLCKFRVLKLQNNKEFSKCYAFQCPCVRASMQVFNFHVIGFSSTRFDVHLTHSRSLSL